MKKLTLLLGLIFVVSFAFSQNNESEVFQDGAFNIATVKQIGAENDAYLGMYGTFNTIWQCQTGNENNEYFLIWNGHFNSTFQGTYFVPWHVYQFGMWCSPKFFTLQLWDPSNTQHQFGYMNNAVAEIFCSNFNKVSQTQGWKYMFPIVGEFNDAFIGIYGGSDYNMVMQAQLLNCNDATTVISDKSDVNTVLQYQFGYGNESNVLITGNSDYNRVGIVQGTAYFWGDNNLNNVDITNHSNFNEVVINQFAYGNVAEVVIENYSDFNDVAIHQENWCCGSYAYVLMTANADANQMSICQWDWGSHEAFIEIYGGDYNRIYTWYDGFMGVPFWFHAPCWGPKVYTEIFWDLEYNVIRQEGWNHHADIKIVQTCGNADFNKVAILQYGEYSENNYASIWIYDGNFNRAGIAQTGFLNTAWIDILSYSDFNLAAISQHTDNQFAYIQVTNGSDFNKANIVQGDSEYDDGYNSAYIYQKNHHDGGVAIINQFWRHNLAVITQEWGNRNLATIYQKAYMSDAYIYETGNDNFASICQHHYGYHYANIYINGNFNGFNNYWEGTSPWFKPSNPGYWFCGFNMFKVMNWVYFDPTNMIRQEGKWQFADINIEGNFNRSSIYQKGYYWPAYGFNNEAWLEIDGNCNITAQYQDGKDNYSRIDIDYANCGKALTFQVGEYNSAAIHQFYGVGNMAGIDQFGHGHMGYISQTGLVNEATINQFDGFGN